MLRWLGTFVAVVYIAACSPTPAPTPSPTLPAPSTEAATLNVTGSGSLCGPWWYGCGAVLVVERPGWTLPVDWAPSPEDIQFAVDLRIDSEKAALVTGIREPGLEQIEPGDYLLAGILTRQSDSATPALLESSVGCSVEVTIPPGTESVSAEVKFRGGCTIDVSVDGSTAERSPSPT
jgi:hypothetical protein